MCGIIGALDLTGNRDFPAEWLRAMSGAIAHRGPDDEYFHREPGLALGTRRLAIVDLAGGRQPLANEDKTVWISFNGELFDYPELRQQLLVRGHHLATRCDTELWVHLYEDHGERVFERRGASLAWHYGTGATGCCCWAGIGWGFFPCTTPRPTAGCFGPRRSRPCWPPEWSSRGPSRGESIICFASSPPARARTSFQGIRVIRPGHYLRVKDGRIEPRRYWDLDFPDAGQERRLVDSTPLVDELEHLLRRAVERRLRGDVPIVCYISGGLDSTVVLGLSTKQRGQPVPAFTIGLDRSGPDERLQRDRVGPSTRRAADHGDPGPREAGLVLPRLDAGL